MSPLSVQAYVVIVFLFWGENWTTIWSPNSFHCFGLRLGQTQKQNKYVRGRVFFLPDFFHWPSGDLGVAPMCENIMSIAGHHPSIALHLARQCSGFSQFGQFGIVQTATSSEPMFASSDKRKWRIWTRINHIDLVASQQIGQHKTNQTFTWVTAASNRAINTRLGQGRSLRGSSLRNHSMF